MNEDLVEWRKIQGFSNYEISNLGEIRSIDRTVKCTRWGTRSLKGKLLSQVVSGFGYRFSVLWDDNKKHRAVYIHIKVLECFSGKKPLETMQGNHIDGNKQNNNISNLEWVTPSENIQHSFRIGLSKRKISPCDRQEIARSNISTDELAKRFDVTKAHIRAIRRKLNKKDNIYEQHR